MIEVKVSGLPVLKARLEGFGKQVPYAQALALTRTAQAVQDKILEETPKRFTIRGSWFKKGGLFGIRLDRATKSKPVARVYTDADWMVRQEYGETRRPKSGEYLAIPGRNVRRTRKEVIRGRETPKAIAAAKSGVEIFTRTGLHILAVRVRGKLRTGMYLLLRSSIVKPRWGFKEMATKEVHRVYKQKFDEALARAIATAK